MVVLGISGGLGHEPAASIVVDGNPIAMVEEERFVRVKRARGYLPILSTLYCLQEAGIAIGDVDIIACSWDPSLEPKAAHFQEYIDAFSRHELFHGVRQPEVVPVPHHLAHAAASFYPSGFQKAGIVIVDGQGENVSTSIGIGNDRSIRLTRTFDVSQSLGYFYSAITRFIGLGPNAYGKTMGLAPYGTPVFDISIVKTTPDGYSIDIDGPPTTSPGLWYDSIRSSWHRWLVGTFGEPIRPPIHLDPVTGQIIRSFLPDEFRMNLAASTQKTLERVLLHLARVTLHDTGTNNLVLGGGVALNCTANGEIWRSGTVDGLYVFPAAHDAGGSLGAALQLAIESGEPRCSPVRHAYWGPEYDAPTIAQALAVTRIEAEEPVDIAEKVAELLCDGLIVGWFQGRMEVGPRALGHRSILANPTVTENLKRVNSVKGREEWRPLAPSITIEAARELLVSPAPSPFMLQAFYMSKDGRRKLPAVAHVDSSTRPQTVSASDDPLYFRLLKEVEKRTGVAAVLNTSFNNSVEPIVCTPYDALRTCFSMGLDALAIGPFLVTKKS